MQRLWGWPHCPSTRVCELQIPRKSRRRCHPSKSGSAPGCGHDLKLTVQGLGVFRHPRQSKADFRDPPDHRRFKTNTIVVDLEDELPGVAFGLEHYRRGMRVVDHIEEAFLYEAEEVKILGLRKIPGQGAEVLEDTEVGTVVRSRPAPKVVRRNCPAVSTRAGCVVATIRKRVEHPHRRAIPTGRRARIHRSWTTKGSGPARRQNLRPSRASRKSSDSPGPKLQTSENPG